MSESDNSSQEKTFDATETKIKQAREKGDVPQSTEANTLLLYSGLIVSILLFSGFATERIFTALTLFLTRPDLLAVEILEGTEQPAFYSIVEDLGSALTPFFILPMTFIILSLIVQRSIVFAPSKLKPQLSRISPISNAKQKYGGSGMVEFLKRFAKLGFIALLAGLFFYQTFFKLSGLSAMPIVFLIKELRDETITLTLFMLAATAIITTVDLPYTIFAHLKKLRMSFQEIKDESKDTEGDPHMKNARRARGRAIAQGSMMRDVKTADVIIVNPTHYAVALKWSRGQGEVPICVAKGVDHVAGQIRRIAKNSNIAIHSDPPCARSLHATVNIGDSIKPEHYAAVAAAIHYADNLKRKAF